MLLSGLFGIINLILHLTKLSLSIKKLRITDQQTEGFCTSVNSSRNVTLVSVFFRGVYPPRNYGASSPPQYSLPFPPLFPSSSPPLPSPGLLPSLTCCSITRRKCLPSRAKYRDVPVHAPNKTTRLSFVEGDGRRDETDAGRY